MILNEIKYTFDFIVPRNDYENIDMLKPKVPCKILNQ